MSITVDCIGCTHGHYPKLDGGDLLIVTGDLTARDTDKEHIDFIEWIAYGQKYGNKYKKIIYIAGNHDNFLYDKKRYGQIKTPIEWNIEYLCDAETEFCIWPELKPACEEILHRPKVKIWGSPWTKTFHGINPHCCAFTCDTEEELAEKWDLIPDDIDILITHGPPYGIRDQNYKGESCGSKSLLTYVAQIKPKLHVFSHIHEQGGKQTDITWKNGTKFVNCSIMNEKYQLVNKPVRILL